MYGQKPIIHGTSRQRLLRAAAVATVLGLLPVGHATADTTLSLAESTVRVQRGSKAGDVATFLVRAEDLTSDQMNAPALKFTDLGGRDSVTNPLKELSTVEVARGNTSRAWLVNMIVEGFPRRSSQLRFARLAFATMEPLVTYTLTDVAPAGFSWTVTAPPSPWLVWRGWQNEARATSVVVTATDGRATGLRLAQASLRETTPTRDIGLDNLELCETADERTTCSRELIVESQSNRTFWLRLRRGTTNSHWWPRGKYTGTISLAVNERPELQSVNVVIHASTWTSVAAGVLLLVIGTCLGWSTNVWARGRVVRLEALTAVAAVRDRATSIERQLDEGPKELKLLTEGIRGALVSIQEGLTAANLDKLNLLPPLIPWAFKSGTDSAAALKDYLTKVANNLAGLQRLIDRGVRAWWTRWWKADDGSPLRRHLEKALASLDSRVSSATDETEADKLIQTVVAELAKDEGMAADTAGAKGRLPAREFLSWQIARIQRWGWFLWGLVTVLSGAAVLLVPNAGFGTSLDLLFCFFWGLGLPVAVDRLQSIGPGGLAGSIGVSLPKTTP